MQQACAPTYLVNNSLHSLIHSFIHSFVCLFACVLCACVLVYLSTTYLINLSIYLSMHLVHP